MKFSQLNEGPCDVATKDDISHMTADEYAKYSKWKADCEDEHRRTPLSGKRFADNEKSFRRSMNAEAKDMVPYFVKEAVGKCKYCGCEIDNPDPACDCKYDSHDASGSNWVSEEIKSNESIYAKNKEDPMNPEVLIQGYGRLMLNQLEDKVGRMFEELAVMCDKGDWSNVEYNLNKGLVQEFIKTINETYEELEQMRKRGGINSRGIKQR